MEKNKSDIKSSTKSHNAEGGCVPIDNKLKEQLKNKTSCCFGNRLLSKDSPRAVPWWTVIPKKNQRTPNSNNLGSPRKRVDSPREDSLTPATPAQKSLHINNWQKGGMTQASSLTLTPQKNGKSLWDKVEDKN